MAEIFEKREYLTQGEVAKRLRVSPSTVKNWRERGCFPYLKPTGSTRVLYPIEGIDDFINNIKCLQNNTVRCTIHDS